MKTTGRWLLALSLLCLISGSARAQGGRGMGMMGGGPGILRSEDVQKELKLTSDQIEKALGVVEGVMADMRDKFGGLQSLSDEERREKMASITREMNAEAKKALKETFKPEQLTRYDQLVLQARSVGAFADREIADKLKLTPDQKSKIDGLAEDMGGQMRDIFQSLQDDREGAMKKMNELRSEVMKKASALLTEEQKSTWKEMIGEPFQGRLSAPFRRPA